MTKNNYLEAAQSLADKGKNYDVQYEKVKAAYDTAEKARNAYDAQDAVRRWASTAYLDNDTNNILYCVEKLEKARAVLDMLSGMYADTDESRPYRSDEYDTVYTEYEKSYGETLLGIKALNAVQTELNAALENNNDVFNRYINAVNTLGQVFNTKHSFYSGSK